jgi:selenocysteine lyase/cysteine desulfurase
MEKLGVELTILSMNSQGSVTPSEIERAIKHNTRAIVLTQASNVTGNGNDIQAIGELCRRHQLLLILDASQTAGLVPIDMKKMNLAALCCSGHKSLLGPQGTGILALGEGVKPRPLKAGGTGMDSYSHEMPANLPEALEAGTLNIHGLAGLLAACRYIEATGQENIYRKAIRLAEIFVEEVRSIPGIRLYGDMEASHRVPVVALNLKDIASGELADELFQRFEIATRAGAHCAPLLHEANHTVEQGMVRFSFSHYNTEQEVREAVSALRLLSEEDQ